MLAHTCVGVAALLRLLVQEQAKGKKEQKGKIRKTRLETVVLVSDVPADHPSP
jgi:hypothetical protein